MSQDNLLQNVPAASGGYEQITDLSSATGLTIPTGADIAHIQALDQNVRYRLDGTDPTGSVGTRIAAGDDIWLPITLLSNANFIEESSGAELNVHYFYEGDHRTS